MEDRFLDSQHKSFLNQTTLNLRKEKWTFLNREFTVLESYTYSTKNRTSGIRTSGDCTSGGPPVLSNWDLAKMLSQFQNF